MPFGLLAFALAASLTLGACMAGPGGVSQSDPTDTSSPAEPAAEEDEKAAMMTDTTNTRSGDVHPVLTTYRDGDGAVGSLAFRSASGVSLSDEAPLRLRIGDERFEAPLRSGPARFTEPNGEMVVDQASYQLPKEAYFALVRVPAAEVVVDVHNGTDYVAYPYISGDLIE